MAIRSYKGVTPSFNSSVYVDESSVLVGDIQLGDNSSVLTIHQSATWLKGYKFPRVVRITLVAHVLDLGFQPHTACSPGGR